MTTPQPVPPGDVERLAKIAYDQLVHAWGLTWEQRESSSVEKYRAVVRAVAAALVPEGFTVVRTDDLRKVLDEAADGCSDWCGDEACSDIANRVWEARDERAT